MNWICYMFSCYFFLSQNYSRTITFNPRSLSVASRCVRAWERRSGVTRFVTWLAGSWMRGIGTAPLESDGSCDGARVEDLVSIISTAIVELWFVVYPNYSSLILFIEKKNRKVVWKRWNISKSDYVSFLWIQAYLSDFFFKWKKNNRKM